MGEFSLVLRGVKRGWIIIIEGTRFGNIVSRCFPSSYKIMETERLCRSYSFGIRLVPQNQFLTITSEIQSLDPI